MKPERWQQIEQLYHAALERAPDARAVFLDQASEGDQALRQEVESLLAYDEQAQRFIERPPDELAAEFLGEEQALSLIGSRFIHYQILSRLGRGGMGEVYLATDTRLDRKVAIKLLPAEFISDPDRVGRFKQEARAASALNHPNILTIYEIGQADSLHFIATEFVGGVTLRERMTSATMSVGETLSVAVQVASALAAAHEAGIIHRDIKPENVMLRPDLLVKVLDFGVAKLTERPAASPASEADSRALTTVPLSTQPGGVMGTVHYMSPEQACGQKIDARSDIFSLGVVLYEMLAGHRPFEGATLTDVVTALLTSNPVPLSQARPDVTPELERVVGRCLEKGPDARCGSAAELRVELQRLQRKVVEEPDEPLATEERTLDDRQAQRLKTPRTSPDQAPERSRWRRWGIAAGATAALLLIALVILWLRESDYFWQNPLDGARIEWLTDFEGDEVDAAISRDGKSIAFLSDRDGQFDAWFSRIGNGDFVNITKGLFSTTAPPGVIRKVGFSGDGAKVWFTTAKGGGAGPYALWLAPVLGGDPHPFLADAMEPDWSPDESKIVYHTVGTVGGDPIFIADRTGSNPRRVFADKPERHCHYLTWSPDSRFIYFVRGSPTTEEMDIWRIPVVESGAPSQPERITYHNARVASPAWLDARTLIYSATAEDGSGQWLYSLDVERRIPHRVSSGITEQYLSVAVSTTRPRRLVASVAIPSASLWTVPVSDHIQTEAAVSRFEVPNTRALAPRFASDYLLFLSSRGGGDGLWKLEKDVARELWKGSEASVVAPPAISADGSQICITYRKQGQTHLSVMNADGTNIRGLAEFLDVRGSAAWSLDGKWITVAANQKEGTRVFKVPVDGGPSVRLVDAPSYNPLWSPDGSFIIYSEPLKGGAFLVKAITPDKVPVPMPDIRVPYTVATPYRFVPGRKALIFLNDRSEWNFFWLDLETRQERQLTDLKPGFLNRSFDVTPDGKQIVFDRQRENSNFVMMDLTR